MAVLFRIERGVFASTGKVCVQERSPFEEKKWLPAARLLPVVHYVRCRGIELRVQDRYLPVVIAEHQRRLFIERARVGLVAAARVISPCGENQ